MSEQDSVAPDVGEHERERHGIDWENLEWTCHFCGELRPDNLIGVASATRLMAGAVEVKLTRRYCRDREECIAAAAQWEQDAELP